MYLPTVFAVVSTLLSTFGAFAQLTAYDSFSSAPGNLAGAASTTPPDVWPQASNVWVLGDGTTNAQAQVSSGSLVSPTVPLQTNGNQASISAVNGSQIAAFRNLNSGSYNSADVGGYWISFLLNPGSNNSGISLFDSTTGNEQIFFGTLGSGSGVGNLGIRTVGGRSTNADSIANTGLSAVSGFTYLIVVSITASSYAIYANPTDVSGMVAPGGSSASVDQFLVPFSFDSIRMGTLANQTSPASSAIDEFRLGTSLASVVPVPEPSVWALTTIACVALFLRKRHRIVGLTRSREATKG